MKNLNLYVNEALFKKLSGKRKVSTREELIDIIYKRLDAEGPECSFNDLDVSNITDMKFLFDGDNLNEKYADTLNCDISEWDVSNVTDMTNMFYECTKFNCDISRWNVSKVKKMSFMFAGCESFNADISGWDVSNVENMGFILNGATSFSHNLSDWDVSKVTRHGAAFINLPIEYRPVFKKH